MKYASAELVEFDGEEAVMRAFREHAVYEINSHSNPVIPLINIEGFTEEAGLFDIWVPISGENPTYFSMVFGNEQYKKRVKETATYTFIGHVAARDLCPNPTVPVTDIDQKHLKRLNRQFNDFIGEWGALLKTTVQYVKLDDAKHVLTSAGFTIFENEDDFNEAERMGAHELIEMFERPEVH
jgi:hypothetical protein